MLVGDLELIRFRNYDELHIELAPTVTVVIGDNGQGKSNLLEAVGYLATLASFRSSPLDALIADGHDTAVVRANGTRDERSLLLEAELTRNGRNRTFVNRQPLRRSRDLLGALRVTVFSPDDLDMVKQGPGIRRRFLDDLLVAVATRNDALRGDLDKILRQRNALLKQAKGRLTTDVAATLDVWDAKLGEVGTALATERVGLVETVRPLLDEAYRALAGGGNHVDLTYEPEWLNDGLIARLGAARSDDIRRGVTTVGPHRDDVVFTVNGRPARTHASQGEQRTLALALRLASHRVVASSTGSPPILLLDDVFSELDASRSTALLRNLPAGQTLLTTAGDVPAETQPAQVLRIERGSVVGR